jgi:hypothetical protein
VGREFVRLKSRLFGVRTEDVMRNRSNLPKPTDTCELAEAVVELRAARRAKVQA